MFKINSSSLLDCFTIGIFTATLPMWDLEDFQIDLGIKYF